MPTLPLQSPCSPSVPRCLQELGQRPAEPGQRILQPGRGCGPGTEQCQPEGWTAGHPVWVYLGWEQAQGLR